jgi:hypothetical protein
MLALWLPVAANYFAGWDFFGGYDNIAFAALFLAMLIFILRMPTARLKDGRKAPVWHWVFVGIVVVGAFGFAIAQSG